MVRSSKLVLALVVGGCSGPAPSPSTPAARGADILARARTCDAVDEDEGRLVVDWSPLDRAKLEASARHGVVPVRVDGCRARIVDTCTIPQAYAFTPTSRQREVIVLRDRDELGARLPILTQRFGAAIARASTVDVAMTVVGRYETGARAILASELEGDCSRVTHVVAGLSVGAFAISLGASTEVDVTADVAHAGHATERRRLDAAGVEEACARAGREGEAPPQDCGIPLRVELRKIGDGAPLPKAAPAAPPTEADAMKQALGNAKKEIATCHRVARVASPDLSGLLTLGLKLARNGNVRSVVAKHEGNLDDGLADCAASRVALVSFPASADDRPRTVVIPVLFAPLAR